METLKLVLAWLVLVTCAVGFLYALAQGIRQNSAGVLVFVIMAGFALAIWLVYWALSTVIAHYAP